MSMDEKVIKRGDIMYLETDYCQDIEVRVEDIAYICAEPVYLVRETKAPFAVHGTYSIDLSFSPKHS